MGHHQRIAESASKQDEHKHAAKTDSTAASDTAYLQSSSDGLTNRQRNVLTAQRTIGNQAVMRRMVQRDADPGAAPGGPQLGQPGSGITASGGSVSIDAPLLNINSATVNSAAAMHTNAGVLKTGTLIADSVVGSSYTPGAGNVW